jgi:DNA-binding NarL/FixJ family response regulator
VRTALRLLIERQMGTWVVEEIGNCPEEVAKIGKQPDVIVADLDSSRDQPVIWLSRLLEKMREVRIVILAGNYDEKLCRRLARLGAMGVVPKGQAVDFLIKAIERVHAGEVWLDGSTVAGLIRGIAGAKPGAADDAETAKMATLTRREREIIDCLGDGLDVAAIARRLFISETTVRHHLTSILGKLGLRDRFNLVFYAYRHGLAAPPR